MATCCGAPCLHLVRALGSIARGGRSASQRTCKIGQKSVASDVKLALRVEATLSSESESTRSPGESPSPSKAAAAADCTSSEDEADDAASTMQSPSIEEADAAAEAEEEGLDADDFDVMPASFVRLARKVTSERGCTTSKRKIRRKRPKVDTRTLRRPIPDKEDVKETLDALAAVEAASKRDASEEEPPPKFAEDFRLEWGPRSKEWEALLERVRRNHELRILEELGPFAELIPVWPEEAVQNRFLAACRDLDHAMKITYHGTRKQNFDSIAKRGLLVPGHGGVKVVHGSAHGVGVYTAKLGKASLSKTFSSGGSLFVCAVCDTSTTEEHEDERSKFVPSLNTVMSNSQMPKSRNAKRIGTRNVTQESDEVRHVGDAVVVFEERCVVPLFLARAPDTPWHGNATQQRMPRRWEPPQQVGRRRLAVPKDGFSSIAFQQPGAPQIGGTVWMTALPLPRASGAVRAVKRRFEERRMKQWTWRDQDKLWKHLDHFPEV